MKKALEFFLFILVFFLSKSYIFSLDNFIAQYQRPITVLEITDSQEFYTLRFASRQKGVFVLLSQAEKIDSIKKRAQDYNNIVLLNPKKFTTSSLVELASCEHFDVTLVHDWAMLQKNPYIVSALLALGDYLILDVANTYVDKILSEDQKNKIVWKHELQYGKQRICLKNSKTSLGKARWVMSSLAISRQPSYTILSTFTEKKLVKGAHKQTSDWVAGINLVSAIMLHVQFPNNEILRENIKQFMQINHNDPVIGNMIVQGKKVKLIDFADSRRNANQEKCIKAALKLFTWMHRPKDPYATIEKYSYYVNN
ncbi:MAG: hypothetical protein K2X90_00570 [Candidatus Babeliaceae bacterium]|nr:hypothetical protein [Candidatus Babeliaceae bacterium]